MSTTELGSPIGAGLADWDLEAFWRARATDDRQGAPDAGAEGDVSLGRENADPADDEDIFWDAATDFPEEEDDKGCEPGERRATLDAGEPGADGDGDPASTRDGGGPGLPMRELLGGPGKAGDALSPLSVSGSEDELDRWMLGSRSQTTEDSAPGSAASSTLDSAEWGLFEPLSAAGAPAAAEAGPSSSKELARHQHSGQLGVWEPVAGAVLACEPAAQVAERPLPSASAAIPSGRRLSEPGPPPALPESPPALPPQGPPAASAAPGGALGLIPDSDLTCLLQVFEEEEPDMLPLHLGKGDITRAGLASAGGTAGGGAVAEASPGSSVGSNKKGRSSGGAGGGWRLLMRRSSELMQYSSWVRDRGRQFGAMEFRGRMLLLPPPAAPAQAPPGGSTAPGQAWGAAIVRDFLLDEVHRAEWDESREASEVLEEWDASACSTARWVRRLPLFLRSREYVVGRRVWSLGACPGVYYCVSKSTEHAAAPRLPTTVRVSSFFSSWRVRALSHEETEQERLELASSSRQGAQGKGKGGRKAQGQEAEERAGPGGPGRKEPAVAGGEGGRAPAVEIITHYEEESGLPRDLVRMGVAHGMWGHMLKMEHALRNYCAAGRSLRHVLPPSLLQQQAAGAEQIQGEEAGAAADPGQLAAPPDNTREGCGPPSAHGALEASTR